MGINPEQDFLYKDRPNFGGALVPLVGPPGSGKTNALIQIGVTRFEADHRVVWRGTSKCQWASFLANDIPVKLWVDENIDELHTTVSNENGVKDIDITERSDVEVERFSSPESLGDKFTKDKVNVVLVPGMDKPNTEKYEKYYFRKTWNQILGSLIERRNVYQFVSVLMDEVGDLWPSQQQLRKPFYSLVAEDLPPLLSQLRKQNVFLYPAGHSTHDMHYYIWKIKANSIIYMSMSVVKGELHPILNKKQDEINDLDRGGYAMPPDNFNNFKLAFEAEDLEVVSGGYIRNKWDMSVPNLLEKDSESENKSKGLSKSKAAKMVYEDTDMTMQTVADIFGITTGAIANA
jgi:hypothetical protein